MELKTAAVEELEARKAEIAKECEAEGADLTALESEVRSINEELEQRKADALKAAEERKAVAEGTGVAKVIETRKKENKMSNEEVRNSKAYIDAFAEGIKAGDMTEARALLTENGTNGTIPVPAFVEEVVRTAWNKSGVMARVKKLYLKGNVKIGFEISGTDAAVHAEGNSTAVTEEELVEGIVTIIPESIKKWISISDELLDMRGEAFLRYLYDEITYKIACKAAKELLTKITTAGTQSTTTAVGVAAITATQITVGLVAKAIGKLADAATEPVVIMNKATWASFKAAQYANQFNVDPFEGLPVVFDASLSTFDAATTGVTYAIVGDLGAGAVANFPNGEGIDFKIDDKTEMTKDLVRVLGREYVGLGIVGPGCFVAIKH